MSPIKSFALSLALPLAACGPILGKPEHVIKPQSAPGNGDIPSDPDGSAPTPALNNLKPAFAASRSKGNDHRIRLSLAGILDAATRTRLAFSPNDNVFVTEDGKLKGLKLTQSDADNALAFDIVFVVDNSGSMSEEADNVADKILAFAAVLAQNGLDARLGIVGYDGAVTGAHDLGAPSDIETYLRRASRAGTERTVGFDGANAVSLETEKSAMETAYSENGVVAISFAQAIFAWRPEAQRVYINFTDEAVQEESVEYLKNRKPWYGTTDYHASAFCAGIASSPALVHTVWSGDTKEETDAAGNETLVPDLYLSPDNEDPFELSRCTGGTKVTIARDAKDLDLTTIDVTKALAGSALIEFVTSDPEAEHELKVTVKNGDAADGETVLRLSYPKK